MLRLSLGGRDKPQGSSPFWRKGPFLLVLPILMTIAGVRPAVADDLAPERGFAAGDVVIRGRMAGLFSYNQKTTIDVIGGRIDSPTQFLPDIDASLFLTDTLSITGQAGVMKTRIRIDDTLYGDIDVGSVWSAPVLLSAQYHVAPLWGVRTYLGAGVVANWYFGEKAAGGYVQDFEVSSQYAPLVKIGFDYPIDENWLVNLEIKQIFVPTQTIQNQGIRSKTSLDAVSVGFGLGYRF